MSELLSKLGIDWRLFLAQVINFLVLFFILKKFLYKPILVMLERRRETIEKSLNDAKKMEEAAVKATLHKEETLREARREAGKIIEEANARAEAMREEKLFLTKQEVEKIIAASKEQLAAEHVAALRSLREDGAELVAAAVSAVLSEIPHEKIDKALVSGALAKLNSDKHL